MGASECLGSRVFGVKGLTGSGGLGGLRSSKGLMVKRLRAGLSLGFLNALDFHSHASVKHVDLVSLEVSTFGY